MKCPNCGMELVPGGNFCGSCGSRVVQQPEQESEKQEQQPEQEPGQKEQPPTPEEPAKEETPVPEDTAQEQPPVQNAVPPVNMAQPQNPASKKGHGKVIGVIAALVAVAAVGAGGFLLSQRLKPSTEKQLVYEKEGSLYYTGNMDKEKDPVKIYDGHAYDCGYYVEIVDDQKYLFFICDMDNSGRLYRVNLQKLTANEEKNEKYIEEIDSHVTDFNAIDSGKVIYHRDGDDLYYYDGKENVEIDSNVNLTYYVEGIEYYSKSVKNSEDELLCYYDFDKKKSVEIGNYAGVMEYDKDAILYTQGSEEDYDLYLAEIGKKPVKLASDISTVDSADLTSGRIYYTRKVDAKKSYYDFVEDPYKEADAKASEPDVKDFLTEVSPKRILNEYAYENYKEDKEDFYYYYCIYQQDTGMYAYYDYDYDTGEDSYYLIDADSNKWGKWDYEAYEKELEAYRQVSERIELRKALKEEFYETFSYDLYCYEAKGGEEKIASNISSSYTDAKTKICLYQKEEENTTEKLCSIDDLDYASELESYLYDDFSMDSTPYYVMIGGKEQKLDPNISNCYFMASEDAKNLMISCYGDVNTELHAYEVKDGELKRIGNVCSNFEYGFWDGSDYYYCTSDGDYCVYSNGKTKTILRDVNSVQWQGGEIYTAYTDYESYVNNKLTLFNGKDKINVDRDVEDYRYINEKRIVYKKNGDLYVYRGKDENRRIDRNVSSFWCD